VSHCQITYILNVWLLLWRWSFRILLATLTVLLTYLLAQWHQANVSVETYISSQAFLSTSLAIHYFVFLYNTRDCKLLTVSFIKPPVCNDNNRLRTNHSINKTSLYKQNKTNIRYKFYCFTVHFNSLNFIHQLMHFLYTIKY